MKKITIVSVVLVLILGMVFTFTACNYESINSIEFSDLSDVELGFSLIFKDGKSYEGELLVEPSNFDYREIEIISDNSKIVDVEVTGKSGNIANYKVTAKYNGIANIIAQTKDGSIKTSTKKFRINGGDDPDYTTDEQNAVYIKSAIQVNNTQATAINDILKQVGFTTLSSASYGWEENEITTILVVSDDLVIDVGIKQGLTQFIRVSENAENETANPLVLYDINANGFIKSISAGEISTYKTKQEQAKTALIRSQVRSMILLTKFSRTTPNSAGGVSVNVTVKNNSSKTIKYVYMSFFAKNAVNDEVYCSIRGSGIRKVSMTGPIAPNETKTGKADCYWYNTTISSQGFNYFEIEYMDGTSVVFTAEMRSALVQNLNH